MVTDCFGLGFWDLSDTEPKFIGGTVLVLTFAIPAGIGVALWKLHIQKRRLGKPMPSTLGLNQPAEIPTGLTSLWTSMSPADLINYLVYVTSALVAFDLGCFSLLLRQLLFG